LTPTPSEIDGVAKRLKNGLYKGAGIVWRTGPFPFAEITSMTTIVKVHCGGNYVASVKVDGVDRGSAGPNNEMHFSIPHNQTTTIEIIERAADTATVSGPLASDTANDGASG
jgi:hypothetical protein